MSPPPQLDNQPCIVEGVVSVDAMTDAVILLCDEIYTFDITTSDPHVDLPISAGEDVQLTSTETFEPAISGVPSFVIRSPEGELLIAWINELDHTPDVGVDPVVFNTAQSGCPGYDGAVLCDEPDDATWVQPFPLEFGNRIAPTVLFPGHSATVEAGDGEATAILAAAERIACWGDTCAGDDSGPFDTLELLLVTQTPG